MHNDNVIISNKFMCVTTVDPAMGMLEIKEILTAVMKYKNGITIEVFDKIHAKISRLVYHAWLIHVCYL